DFAGAPVAGAYNHRFMIGLALSLALLSQDLPTPPEGLQLREVVKLGVADDSQPARVQPHPKSGLFYVLYVNGDLWQVEAKTGEKKLVLDSKVYFRKDSAKFVQALGLYIDPDGLTYVVV